MSERLRTITLEEYERAEIRAERAEAELGRLRLREWHCTEHGDALCGCRACQQRAEATAAELAAALRAFDRCWKWNAAWVGNWRFDDYSLLPAGDGTPLTVGDFRNAKESLARYDSGTAGAGWLSPEEGKRLREALGKIISSAEAVDHDDWVPYFTAKGLADIALAALEGSE